MSHSIFLARTCKSPIFLVSHGSYRGKDFGNNKYPKLAVLEKFGGGGIDL